MLEAKAKKQAAHPQMEGEMGFANGFNVS